MSVILDLIVKPGFPLVSSSVIQTRQPYLFGLETGDAAPGGTERQASEVDAEAHCAGHRAYSRCNTVTPYLGQGEHLQTEERCFN